MKANKNIKVLYLVHDTRMSGATISLFNLVLGLQRKGFSPIVAGPDSNEGQGSEMFFQILKENNIPYHAVMLPKQVWPPVCNLKQLLMWPVNVLRLIRWTRLGQRQLYDVVVREQPDIIHTNTGVLRIGYKVAKSLGIPHVWHIREYQDLDFGWKIFPNKSTLLKAFKDNNYVITITDELLDYFKIAKHPRCQRIYNGIFSETESQKPQQKENFFLCCSQVVFNKGHETAIRAFAEFYKKHKDYKLVILGFGDTVFIDSMKQLSQTLGCAEAVEWKGYTKNVKDYMIKAKALIVASRFEGFGRMTAEAAMLGCITLGRATGGTKEILDKIGGYLFSFDSELCDKMEAVARLSDEEYYNKAIQIQQKAVELYSIEQNIAATQELYNNILQKNNKE